jgi:hypothetical protein
MGSREFSLFSILPLSVQLNAIFFARRLDDQTVVTLKFRQPFVPWIDPSISACLLAPIRIFRKSHDSG